MNFLIFMCCTAHLLTGISSRLRRTTPMPPALRSDDAEEKQVAKFAEMIDFVNSAPNNNGRRSSFRRHGPSKRRESRRLNELMAALYGFAELKEIENVDNFNIMKEIKEKVRLSIIDNPDDLMKHRSWQKNNMEEIQEDTTFNELKYSTAVNKWDDFRVAPELIDTEANVTIDNNATAASLENATVHVRRRTQDNFQELTTNKTTYRPSSPDDEDDDKLAYNEKQNNKPKTKEEDHYASQIIVQKKTQHNKPSSKEDKAQINKNKADKHNSKEIDTKKEHNKEYKLTKFIYSQEKLNEDRIRPKDEPDDKINREDGDTNENRGKDKNQQDSSRDKNKSNFTSLERLILKRDNNLHNNRDRIEQHSIYLHKGISENSNKQSKKSHEEIDKYDKMMKEKFRDMRDERESQWIKVDTQNDYKENIREKNEEIWSKKERDWDKNHGEWSRNEKDWDNNDRWNDKDKNWDNDDTWNKKEKYWNNKKRDQDTDKGFDPMENEWNKRHPKYDIHAQSDDNDHATNKKNFKEIDNYYKKRDSEFYKRDNDWTKRDSGEDENRDRTYDRNESGNKKSYERVDQERVVRHDRYKVVDRVDSGSSRDNDRF